MTDRPILFSAPMVRALHAGIKTQTRRIHHASRPSKIAVGDRLWVRESWQAPLTMNEKSPTDIVLACLEAGYKQPWCPIHWPATDGYTNWGDLAPWKQLGRKRASLHLPRPFSRMTLVVTEKRIEPLQVITEADAVAEGVTSVSDYQNLWDSLNTIEGYNWADNPLVTVIGFNVHKINIDNLEVQS